MLLLLFAVAIAAGSVAAIAGFGIGSLLTPVFALLVPLKIAVAAVAIPHLAATAARLWMLRGHVDRRLFASFGVTSALGGLAGALLFNAAGSPVLALIFGMALILTAFWELTGRAGRVRFGSRAAWLAGAVSGLLGGMVGNQGGIRSAALLGFQTTRLSFVATATAIALVVDIARIPVYLAAAGAELRLLAGPILLATAGALAGTFAGKRLLDVIPEAVFRRSVAILILLLGTTMLGSGIRDMF